MSCLRCQGYKKSCRGGAPPTGVKLPKRRRTAVVTDDDDDDDDDDAPKAESSRSKTRSKGKGKEKERVEEEKEEESEEEEEEGEGPAESERTRLRPKGRWAKLEAELRGLDVRELLVRSVVETAQLRVALAPLLRSVREIVDTKERIDAWEAYAAGGVVPPNPKQFTPDGDWEEDAETSGSSSGSGSEESGSGKEGEGQQESGEGSDPKAGPSGGN